MESVGRLMINLDFYKGKKVFITGHTGFKGTWLCEILTKAGAIVTGYSINVPTNPSLFELSNMEEKIESITGDIRNLETLEKAFNEAKPEIVFHLAAQPLVIESYKNPVYTYETNVMGTVNILECIRKSNTVKSFVNITTDKVYKNNEWERGYKEDDVLNGYDPYSNSKSCSELVTDSYKKSFLNEKNVQVSTARNPNSIRPFQHVLEPLFAYLLIAEKQYQDSKYSGNYNIGPELTDCITTGELTTIFCNKWGEGLKWETQNINGPHEANFLKLDCAKMKQTFNWKPNWNIEKAVEKTVEFAKKFRSKEKISNIMDEQIEEYKKTF